MLQRAGYILDSLAKGTGKKTPESVLRICSKGVRTPARLYPSRPGKGTYSRRWKIIDNSDKGELLGWF
jgi:predicted transcriptional regulator of viral defense system